MKVITRALVYCACIVAVSVAKDITGRIVNGNDVEEVIRHHAHIEIARPGDDIRIGSGTIISETAVITSGPNVVGFQAWRVGAGALTISDLFWQVVSSATVHPDYDAESLSNNLAILILFAPLPAAANVQPIVLVPTGVSVPQENAVVVFNGFGFNSTDDNKALPPILQEATQTVISQQECAVIFPHLVTLNTLDLHFCAIDLVNKSNVCGGDQGTGIYMNWITEVLVGVTSSNRVYNCSSDYPTLHTRLEPYIPWINTFL